MTPAYQDVTADVLCHWCAWGARMTGPALEVAHFLRTKLIEHVESQHPDHVPTIEEPSDEH